MHHTLEERAGRYNTFTERHKQGGEYRWELGLGGLLSALSPDPKAFTLYSMPLGTPSFTSRQLYGNVLNFAESLGLPRRFPVAYSPVWQYCSHPQTVEGSLVSIGTVVRELRYLTPEGERTAYLTSEAGHDLARPLVVAGAEWIRWAGNSDIQHKYDSMWKVLGAVASKTENRRPLAIYRIVEYLVRNRGYHRLHDLIEEFGGRINDGVISNIMNSLGDAGIIDYESPSRDVQGVRARGWATYRLNRMMYFGQALDGIRKVDSDFHNVGYLRAVINHVKPNGNEVYEANDLSQKLKIGQTNIPHILSLLKTIGMLKRECGFSGGTLLSKAGANDLTRSLYEMVLVPARETAEALKPAHTRQLTPELARGLLVNYQEERTNKGPEGGEETRGE